MVDCRGLSRTFPFDGRRVVVTLPASVTECDEVSVVVEIDGVSASDALRSPQLRRAVRRAVGNMVAELAGHRARVAIQFDRPERVELVVGRMQ